MEPLSIQSAIKQAEKQLAESRFNETPRLDAELLLSHLLQKSRTYLIAHSELTLTQAIQRQFETLLKQRQQGMPLAYLIGEKEFWSLCLKVTTDTLIPRPETESLVEQTLALLSSRPDATLLDLGTGSGAIAIALAHERPSWQIYASDFSKKALAVAKLNAKKYALENIEFLYSNWFDALPDIQFDAIVSNPPYIASDDSHLIASEISHEPISALSSGKEGLDDIKIIVEQCPKFLKPGGLILIEHGYHQKAPVHALLNQAKLRNCFSVQDLQGHDRISGGWKI